MPMTPQEELFAKFFNGEKALVSQMSDLELRAHREELSKIAFEARARLTAIQEESGERSAKNKKGNKTFQSSIESDDITSDAIITINARKAKMSKIDKQIDNMVAMGIDRAVAEKMFEASTLLALKHKQKGEVLDLTKKAKDTTIISVDNHICPECQHEFNKKLSGSIECPQCTTKLNLIKSKALKAIRGKCPTCLHDFENKVSGDVTCPKCSTIVHVLEYKPLANPFASPALPLEPETGTVVIENESKTEISVAEPEKPKQTFNPFEK